MSNVTVHGVDGGVLDANLCDGQREGVCGRYIYFRIVYIYRDR